MVTAGINCVRVYTVPPPWLLDVAGRQGLLVFAGLPWQQHVAFLDDPEQARQIEQRVREGMRSMAGHPALLGVAIGNEIPASIVRWHGKKKIEDFLRRLYRAAKAEDPTALITYVNFPTTEYLNLDFLDFCCFNVYLEDEDRLKGYLARLQTLAGDKPLVMAEIGLDSRRNGCDQQADTLRWQVEAAFRSGAAGAFVFAWTDEWHRGGFDIEDWDFGLTTRWRHRKPALFAVAGALRSVPIRLSGEWPRVSVVVCSYNGARTISDTLEHLERVDYPNFEVIVVSDGSTDSTASIARKYDNVFVIETENRGLSAARNSGMLAASGEIIAYIDDDAYPDPHWLHYLAHAFRTTRHAAIGGPAPAPDGDGEIAHCVARAPGGPVHVLLTDELAEHIPGCNFAIRKQTLMAIGGFDPLYRAAGDDVDVCWRLHECGETIGFHPGALVFHHRRNSLKAYWKQQCGYGKAEALLERKWPEKYNAAGHVTWAGRLYGHGVLRGILGRARIYHGVFNSAPFQSLYRSELPLWQALPQMPEWFGLNVVLAGLCLLGLSWRPLLALIPLLIASALVPFVQIAVSGWRAGSNGLRLRLITIFLFMIQPIARLRGRIAHGLTPFRRDLRLSLSLRNVKHTWWSEQWADAPAWLTQVQAKLRGAGWAALTGHDFDSWDLQIRGLLGGARLQLAIEEHGGGKQLLRWRAWPRLAPLGVAASAMAGVLAIAAGMNKSWVAAGFLGCFAIAGAGRAILEAASALHSIREALKQRS